MLKRMLAVVAGSLLAASGFAANPELRSDHPQTYTVVRGDTLWDISARFLKSPWLWPEIWQANSQIENPHLIYPGDQISLVYIDGQPRLVRGNGGNRPDVVKLSPQVRNVGGDRAIQPIPLEHIKAFLEQTRVYSDEAIKHLPYVVENEESRLVSAPGQLVYVRGLDARPGDAVDVVRPTVVYRELPARFPWTKSVPRKFDRKPYDGVRQVTFASLWLEGFNNLHRRHSSEILGHEVQQVSRARVLKSGDPATLELLDSNFEVMKGDLVVAADTHPYDASYSPHAPDAVPANMRVLGVSGAERYTGPYRLVALSRGARDGVANGEVYALYQPSRKQRDKVKFANEDLRTVFPNKAAKVVIPEEFLGHAMVFRTFEKVSYALVMDGIRPIQLNDIALAPQAL